MRITQCYTDANVKIAVHIFPCMWTCIELNYSYDYYNLLYYTSTCSKYIGIYVQTWRIFMSLK